MTNIDLLHIDAQHNGTFLEWELFLPKVEYDGIIMLHDTALHNGPIKLVEQIKGLYPTKMFKAEQGYCGVTIVKNVIKGRK